MRYDSYPIPGLTRPIGWAAAALQPVIPRGPIPMRHLSTMAPARTGLKVWNQRRSFLFPRQRGPIMRLLKVGSVQSGSTARAAGRTGILFAAAGAVNAARGDSFELRRRKAWRPPPEVRAFFRRPDIVRRAQQEEEEACRDPGDRPGIALDLRPHPQ